MSGERWRRKASLRSRVDLHVHSNKSDGVDSPTELVRKAKDLGIGVLSLTDHDTVDGVEECSAAGRDIGVEVIPGVEVKCQTSQGAVEILGFYIDINSRALQNMLLAMRDRREERARKMLRKLRARGIDISMRTLREEVGDGPIGRPHIARIIHQMGFAESPKDAFLRYIRKGAPCYVMTEKFHAAVVVKGILDAGGVPSLAHPGCTIEVSNLEDVLKELVSLGLRGIEVIYPYENSPHRKRPEFEGQDIFNERMYRLCKELRLIPTGGSDYHGDFKSGELGELLVPQAWVKRLKAEWKRIHRA